MQCTKKCSLEVCWINLESEGGGGEEITWGQQFKLVSAHAVLFYFFKVTSEAHLLKNKS